MARRSRTCRPTDHSECCPFFFLIAFDESGFYVRNGYGCSNRVGNPKISSDKNNYKVWLLTPDHEKLIAKSVIDANACKGFVWNIICNRTGQTVSLNACHYLGTLGKDLKRLACLDNLSSSDRIIQFFQDKNYDYILLYNSMNQFSPETIDLLNDNFVSSKMLYTNTNL